MPLEQMVPYIPVAAVVVGVVLVLWSERNRIRSAIGAGPTEKTESELTPAERFDKFYALRNWCERSGAAEAVEPSSTHRVSARTCSTYLPAAEAR
jgi:hypothetical protein